MRTLRPDDIQLLPTDYCARIDWGALFPEAGSVEIDVGCGDGGFLLEMARRHPERAFLGIERLLGRVRKICRKAAREGLRNVRILRLETQYAIEWMIPPGSVATLHVLFPDPWPKTRHRRRRLVGESLLDAAHAALESGGELRIKTDHPDYARVIGKLVAGRSGWESVPWPSVSDEVVTDFERGFLAEGRAIHRYRLRKVSIGNSG